MTPTSAVRPVQARLLADTRGADARARLAQAISRSEFLLRLTRSLAALQSPERSLVGLVDLLLEELVDVAEVVVRSPGHELRCGGVHGRPLHETAERSDDLTSPSTQAMDRGEPQEIELPRERTLRAAALADYVSGDAATLEAAADAAERLMLLPLTAHGRTFGLLVLGRRRGFVDGSGFLEDLAARVGTGLDSVLLLAESRHVASVLRRSLAPDKLPSLPRIALATYFRVAHESEQLGGDFVDVHGPADDVIVVCGDVAGRGVEAAVQGKRIRNAVRTAAQVDRSPGWILELVNRVRQAEDVLAESVSTAVCGRLRLAGDRLDVELASAGHPPALVLRADGTIETIEVEGEVLGLLRDSTYPTVHTSLAVHDTLILHTNGLTESRGSGEPFGEQRLHAVLRTLVGAHPSALAEAAALALSDHLGDRPHDDVALLVVQLLPEQR